MDPSSIPPWYGPLLGAVVGALIGALMTRWSLTHADKLARAREDRQHERSLLFDRYQLQRDALKEYLLAAQEAQSRSGPVLMSEPDPERLRGTILLAFGTEDFATECVEALRRLRSPGPDGNRDAFVQFQASQQTMRILVGKAASKLTDPGSEDPGRIRANLIATEDRALGDAATNFFASSQRRGTRDRTDDVIKPPDQSSSG